MLLAELSGELDPEAGAAPLVCKAEEVLATPVAAAACDDDTVGDPFAEGDVIDDNGTDDDEDDSADEVDEEEEADVDVDDGVEEEDVDADVDDEVDEEEGVEEPTRFVLLTALAAAAARAAALTADVMPAMKED